MAGRRKANEVDVLVDAAIHGDVKAAKKHGISRTTVYRYRRDMTTRRSQFDEALKAANIRDVEEVLGSALHTAAEHLQLAVQEVEHTPEGLDAITNATRALAEIYFGIKMIRARIDAVNQADRDATEGRPGPLRIVTRNA